MGWLSHGTSAFDPACLSRPCHGHIILLPRLSRGAPPSGGLLSLCRGRLALQLAQRREHRITIEYVCAVPQRTSPPCACKSSGVTRKTVKQLGHRVIRAIPVLVLINMYHFLVPANKIHPSLSRQSGYHTIADKPASPLRPVPQVCPIARCVLRSSRVCQYGRQHDQRTGENVGDDYIRVIASTSPVMPAGLTRQFIKFYFGSRTG